MSGKYCVPYTLIGKHVFKQTNTHGLMELMKMKYSKINYLNDNYQ